MKKIKKKTMNILIFGIIVCSCAIAVFYITESKSQTPDYLGLTGSILLSVFCSIVASGIFVLLQTAADSDEHVEEMAVLQSIHEGLRRTNDLYDSGIISIRKKSYYEEEGKFWRDMISNTVHRIDLIGHSISNWFRPEYRDIFIKKVVEMLTAGNTVRIILSGNEPNMDKIHRIEKKGKETPNCKFDNKLDKTCWELRKIYKQIPLSKRDNLQVYIAKPEQVTYMYIRTDNQCFISPYLTGRNNDSNTFLLELKTKIEYSRCFDEDFEELLKSIPNQLELEG